MFFPEVNHLKEGYVMHLTSGKREDIEVQEKKNQHLRVSNKTATS